MSFGPIYSTGRGGAGNMVNSIASQKAANEIVMTEEEAKKSNPDNGFYSNKSGKYVASSGRGGAGNIATFDKPPSPKLRPRQQELELSPVFSTGRGGAGNIYKTKSNLKTTMEEEIDNQLSPLHSTGSHHTHGSRNMEQSTNVSGLKTQSQHGSGFFKKIKKIFS